MPPSSSSPSAPANYLCLFPEKTDLPIHTSDSSDYYDHTLLSSYEHPVGVVNSYEEVGESLLEQHLSNPRGDTQHVENEFAELDPFLAMSQGKVHPSMNCDLPAAELDYPHHQEHVDDGSSEVMAPPTLAPGLEVGVATARESGNRTFVGADAEEGEEPDEESASPLESVLYS